MPFWGHSALQCRGMSGLQQEIENTVFVAKKDGGVFCLLSEAVWMTPVISAYGQTSTIYHSYS